jgi:hypothetical protein
MTTLGKSVLKIDDSIFEIEHLNEQTKIILRNVHRFNIPDNIKLILHIAIKIINVYNIAHIIKMINDIYCNADIIESDIQKHISIAGDCILFRTNKYYERILSNIMIVGCGHHHVLDEQYTLAHNHNNIFTLDCNIGCLPDVVINVYDSNMRVNDEYLLELKGKFKIIVTEGCIFTKKEHNATSLIYDDNDYKQCYKNMAYFLEEGGIIIGTYNSCASFDSRESHKHEEYSVYYKKKSNESMIITFNDQKSLIKILQENFPDEYEKLFDIMYTEKINVYT